MVSGLDTYDVKYRNTTTASTQLCQDFWGINEGVVCDQENCDCDFRGDVLTLPGESFYQQVGILSYSSGCATGTTVIYTEVFHHLDWISSVTGLDI